MLLRKKIENILLNSYMTLGDRHFREMVLDEIMNEISKDVYGKAMDAKEATNE